MAKKAKAERDEQWAQNSLNNADKKDIKSRSYSDDSGASDDDVDDEESNVTSDLQEESRSSTLNNGASAKSVTDVDSIFRGIDNESNDIQAKRSSNQKDVLNQKISQKQDPDQLSKINGRQTENDIAIEEESNTYEGKKTDESREKSSKFSSKPNLNVILKKSLKDSLYSINVDGFYSNNGSSAITEMKSSGMNPLVRNSLLLSEQVEIQKKLGASKVGEDTVGFSSTDDTMDNDATFSSDEESDDDLREFTAEELQLLELEMEVSEDQVSKSLNDKIAEAEQSSVGEVSTLDYNEYLLPPALLSKVDIVTDLGADSFPSSSSEEGAGDADGVSGGGPVSLITADTKGIDGTSPQMASRVELDEIPDYDEESIERSVQRQQAAEYAGDFSDAVPLYRTLPPFSESSSSDFLPFSSIEDTRTGTVPLCLLGDWELAEQRYLDADRYPPLYRSQG